MPMMIPEWTFPNMDQERPQPSKTYAWDWKTGKIGGKTDGADALRQFIVKAIRTPRYRHLIYPPDYGCEIHDLIGEPFSDPLVESEIRRTVTEALVYDDRVRRVKDVSTERNGDRVRIHLTVVTTEGDLNMEEVI